MEICDVTLPLKPLYSDLSRTNLLTEPLTATNIFNWELPAQCVQLHLSSFKAPSLSHFLSSNLPHYICQLSSFVIDAFVAQASNISFLSSQGLLSCFHGSWSNLTQQLSECRWKCVDVNGRIESGRTASLNTLSLIHNVVCHCYVNAVSHMLISTCYTYKDSP